MELEQELSSVVDECEYRPEWKGLCCWVEVPPLPVTGGGGSWLPKAESTPQPVS